MKEVEGASWTYACVITPGDTVWVWLKNRDEPYGALVMDTVGPFPKGAPLPMVTLTFREANIDNRVYYADDLLQVTKGNGPIPKEPSTLKNFGVCAPSELELDLDPTFKSW